MVLPKVFLSLFAIMTLGCSDLRHPIEAVAVESRSNKDVEFKVQKILLNKKMLKVWVASTDAQRSKGMMFKTKWGEGIGGMLFIFNGESRRSFWMKNTLLPLSLAYFDKSGVLLEVADMDPPKSLAQVKVDRSVSAKPAKYVLEVPKGWFKKTNIQVGAKLRFL